MTHITFVRHGQANTQATTAQEYDRLSPLGARQATWLGQYLRDTESTFDHVWSGDMARHRATAASMALDAPKLDKRLNEFDYFTIARLAELGLGLPTPQNSEEFAHNIPKLMEFWRDDAFPDAPEKYSEFENRAQSVIDDILGIGGRALVVTSGGLVSMVLRRVLRLEIPEMTRLMFLMRNTAITEIEFVHGHLMLSVFNAVPHLAAPERAQARTFI